MKIASPGGVIALEAVRERRRRRERAWSSLRQAIADDLVDKLPELVPVARIPHLMGVPAVHVVESVRDGRIAVRVVDGVDCMVTAESRPFLATESGIRLPLPTRLHPSRNTELLTIGVSLRRTTVDALSAASRALGLSLREYVSGIVEASARPGA